MLKHHLFDVLDLSVHPLLVGSGRPSLREGRTAALRLVAAKTFPKGIVKLTYEPQYC